ncbi:hypothetical protein C1I99_04920 [Micromonospora deserti]|uniref:F5/8 type C domain-containing protein n=1 Tax=Micromonospora deserti TaxID=2070366 RepID=A0A2W2CQX4_9ACTN|nr:hypothetical protein C1I99_04920 [Micromonospora deserti]
MPALSIAGALAMPRAAAASHHDIISSGNYYLGVTPDDGSPDRDGGLIPLAQGALGDGDPSRFVGWRGASNAPRTIALVFDLLNDLPLAQIRIVSNAPAPGWGFTGISVTYRSEGDTAYRLAGKATRTGETDYELVVPMADRSARFVRIEIIRSSALLHVPLSHVEIQRGHGDAGPHPGPAFTVAQLRAELGRYTRLADRYGQYLYQDWPGKVTSDDQLQREYAQEAAALAGVALDPERYDRYGGVKSLGRHGATGYFRVKKVDGRWWFVTPDGHLFFLKAVDAFSEEEWGYGTVYENPDGSPRDMFDELPDPDRFANAYAVVENGLITVNFVKANLMRKYGDNYKAKWRDLTHRRMLDWGFNAQGKWHRDPAVPFPYIERAPTPLDVIKVRWAIDPFDPDFSTKLDRTFNLRPYRTDPWLIGYFFENERGWNREVVGEVVRQAGDLPAKRAFIHYLADAYADNLTRVNELLGTSAPSFRALADEQIDINRVPPGDVAAFITLAAKRYFQQVRNAIKRQDPNHLFLGSCLVPTWRTSPEWNAGGVDHVDVLSFDWYSNNISELTRYGVHDKPIVNLEYCFMLPDRGMTSHNPSIAASSQADRGVRYASFIEALARTPFFIGSAWFAHYDQAVTNKPGSTEAFNIGLVNQQDQPYHEMTNIMRETNRSLEMIHLQAPPS